MSMTLQTLGSVATTIVVAALATVPATDARAQSSSGEPAASDFVTKARAGFTLRSSSFKRTQFDEVGPAAEAWGLGGWLWGESGEIGGMFSVGGAYYLVGALYGPKDSGNTSLLEADQTGYSVLGEAWARLRYGDHSLTAGRQALAHGWSLDGIYRTGNRYDGAFIGKRDIRGMNPLNFETASVAGKLAGGTVRYYGGYAWQMRKLNGTGFEDLAAGASLPGESDGMFYAGGQWKTSQDTMLQGAYHSVQDQLDIGWVDFDYVHRLGNNRYLRLDTQFIHQASNGQEYLGRFTTHNIALYGEARLVSWWIPYGAIGVNGDGEELRSPYSLGPSYLVQRIGENAKAGEKTWIVGSTFDFGSLGVQGLSFDVNYGSRRDRHLAGDSAKPLADWTELATDLIYVFPKETGWLATSRLRLRLAYAWQKGDNYTNGSITSIDQKQIDARIDLQIPLKFL